MRHLQPAVRAKPANPLSERERMVLALIVAGHSNPEIALMLHISLSTVKAHIRSIMNKLVAGDRKPVAKAG